MNSVALYFLIMLDNIKHFLAGILIFGSIYLFITLVISFIFNTDRFGETDKDELKASLKVFKTPSIFILVICSAILLTFIPTTKQMAAIVIIPKVYNSMSSNEELKKIPNQVIDLANSWLNELKPENVIINNNNKNKE